MNTKSTSTQKQRLRVWWIPQIPMKPFRVEVDSIEEGVKVMNILADYDDFQLSNNIKPEYANTGGLQMFDPEDTSDGPDGSWCDWCDEETGEDDPVVFLSLQNEEELRSQENDQKCNADLLASCRELIEAIDDYECSVDEAIDDYECSVDDPPTPKHREMMLRAMKAVEKATQANLRSEAEEKAFREAEYNEHIANHRKATQENGGVSIRLGIDTP